MSDLYRLDVCRGMQGNCRFALASDASAVQAVEKAIADSLWVQRMAEQRSPEGVRRHELLKVALAACPNACTMPQIRDIGIVATQRPTEIAPACDGCGGCEQTCREGAVAVRDGRAVFCPERCIGCGTCIPACPRQVIGAGPVALRVLAGGRMGRHPQWALEISTEDRESVAGAVTALLDLLARHRKPREGIAAVLERLGVERVRPRVKQRQPRGAGSAR